jgi:hypothetical protein
MLDAEVQSQMGHGSSHSFQSREQQTKNRRSQCQYLKAYRDILEENEEEHFN